MRCERRVWGRTWLLVWSLVRLLLTFSVVPRQQSHPLLHPLSLNDWLADLTTDRDDPDSRQEDDGPEGHETELEGWEGSPLVVVDEAGDDGGEIVETECERTDEGRADESQGAVEVE
jgi:hypothetical protein